MDDLKVFKFGGACLKDAQSITNAGAILQHFDGDKLLLVVSAVNKTTNQLEKVVNAFFSGNEEAVHMLQAIQYEHVALANELGINDPEALNEIEDCFIDALWILEDEIQDPYDYIYDQIVALGELASSKLNYHYFKSIGVDITWLDVRDVLRTDESYRSGVVDWVTTEQKAKEKIASLLLENKVIITQGFIGSTQDNTTTTLGREGSDYTASILAYCVDANSVHVWKDVEGIMTGDPKLYKNATLIKQLSFSEAIEMCYFGAKVLHPKTIKPIQNKNIPLFVRPFGDVTNPGTAITTDQNFVYPPIVIIEENQVLIELAVKDFSFVAEHHLSEIFAILKDLKIKVYLMRNTAINFIFSTKYEEVKIAKLNSCLEDSYFINITSDLTLTTVRHADLDFARKELGMKKVFFEEQFSHTLQLLHN